MCDVIITVLRLMLRLG